MTIWAVMIIKEKKFLYGNLYLSIGEGYPEIR